MNGWTTEETVFATLRGVEGELCWAAIAVDARDLEDLLEALASASFPINPEIRHNARSPETGKPLTVVEFPLYAARIRETEQVLEAHGFSRKDLLVSRLLDRIQQGPARATQAAVM